MRTTVLLLLVVMMHPSSLRSQSLNSLKGLILDSKTGQPVPFTTVYLAKTLIGTQASPEGAYELKQIPEGKYDLTASCVGYKTQTIPWSVTMPAEVRNITLDPEIRTLTEVIVTDHSAKKKYITLFKENFLGGTVNAGKCSIINTDDIIVDYEKDSAKVTAFCAAPIEVENRALGYRLFYTLTDFRLYIGPKSYYVVTEGVPRFEMLIPKDKKEEKKWIEARDEAYRGSLNHFMRSLKNSRLKADLFEVLMPQEEYGNNILVPVEESYILSSRPDSLRMIGIIYHGEYPDRNCPIAMPTRQKREVSSLKFSKTGLKVYKNGYYDLPKNFYIDGYMGWSGGIAELVPMEYEPTTEK